MSDQVPSATLQSASQPVAYTAVDSTLPSGCDSTDCIKCEACDSLGLVLAPKILPSPIAIPLPPIPPKTTVLPKTIESESQTDMMIVEPSTAIPSNNDSCDQVSHDQDQRHEHERNSVAVYQSEDRQQSEPAKQETIATKSRDQQTDQADEATTLNSMEISANYLGEPEVSLVQIHDKLIDHGDLDTLPADSSESEEEDQLKPLMVDNHQECYMNKRQVQQILQQNAMKDLLTSSDSDHSVNYLHQQYHRQPLQPQYLLDQAYDSSDILSSDETAKEQTSESSQLPDGVKEIDTLSPDEIPDDRMAEEIVEQVEFYFSNENILKDAFLLKHVRRNKEGFVSLKLVSSFKRVRQLTKDWRAVGHAIRRKSRKIELNDVATKIRRVEPLPTFDETMPSRTIVACDLPVDKLCIERVYDIFAKCGEIALIRILRPGTGIPVDVRQFMNKYPEMQMKECALVEFVESQSARNARNIDGPFQVFEMVAPKKKTGKKAITVTKLIENYKYPENNYERNRGGVAIPMENEFKFKLRRNNSEFYVKPEHAHICTQRRYSYNATNNNNNHAISNTTGISGNTSNNIHSHMHAIEPNFMHYPRRISNFSVASSDAMSRKYSSCSDGYSSCSEFSRRPSGASTSDSRRASNCSDYCACTRRGSHGGGGVTGSGTGSLSGSPNLSFASDLLYRRMSAASHSSDFNNELSRRISIESNDPNRKLSTGSNGSDRGGMHDNCRKFSNGFDPNRKLSNGDQYFNGRRLSTDSGYDRKMSFGSDYGSSPRSRSGSFLMCQHKNNETVVRTPIGPDGSKGFASRARKVGQIVSPV